jgi:DNA-binding IclR family transcriptional regulator
MPIPAPEFDSIEDPVAVVRDFLKQNSKDAWAPEEISERTGLDMTAVYHICQLLRAQYVECTARGEYFPIRSIERLGQTYFKWVSKTRKSKSE